MFGLDLHEYFRQPWEQARGMLSEELDQLKAELRGRWNAALGPNNELNVNAIGGDGTPATRYVANTGVRNAPTWDLVNLVNGVKNRLRFIHIVQIGAGKVLGRRSATAGDIEEITPDAADLAIASTTLALTATGVTAGTYGDASNVAQITVDAKGRITAAVDVPIADAGSWIPLVDGSEPPVFITDGAGVLILVAYS